MGLLLVTSYSDAWCVYLNRTSPEPSTNDIGVAILGSDLGEHLPAAIFISMQVGHCILPFTSTAGSVLAVHSLQIMISFEFVWMNQLNSCLLFCTACTGFSLCRFANPGNWHNRLPLGHNLAQECDSIAKW
jgi:hypothetical protein